MPRGVPNKKYTPEFKNLATETMQKENLGYRETAERFGVRHKRAQDWERIYFASAGRQAKDKLRRRRFSCGAGQTETRPNGGPAGLG